MSASAVDKPKRLSLLSPLATTTSHNTPPSPRTSGPRPLQLVDGPYPSPAGPSTAPISLNSPVSAASSSRVQSPTDSNSSRRPLAPRRQSSISYVPRTRELESSSPSFTAVSRSQSQSSTDKWRNRRSIGPGSTLADSEQPPLTLTEKYADLLHFIAQKESKCLELRSQLAAHEAELLAMKRKWERIVSRGVGANGLSSADSHSLRNSLASPYNSNSTQAAVLDGIKEGMHGVGRFIAGLGDLTPPSPPPTALEPRGTRVSRENSNRQSTSSVSTQATSSAARLSQSSMSSVGGPDEEVDRMLSSSPLPADEAEEQVIEVKLDNMGATATFSPNPASVYTHHEDHSPSRSSKPTEPIRKISPRKSRDHPSPDKRNNSITSQPTSTAPLPLPHHKSHDPSPPSISIPPPSSIPGLNTFSSAATSSAAPPFSSWVGQVGKKWGEIQKGQKRASVLLSDVSTSLFAALAPPAPAPTHSQSKQRATRAGADNEGGGSLSHATSSHSLLDDENTEELGCIQSLSAEPYPSSPHSSTISPTLPRGAEANARPHAGQDDDEDWNW